MIRGLPMRCVWLLGLLIILATGQVAAQEPIASYPKPVADHVNDFAKVLASQDQEALARQLKRLEYQTGIEMAVVTVEAMGDYGTSDRTIEDFATHLFNAWGIGHKKTNDGILILVSVRDRKVRIELGGSYGHRYDSRMASVLEQVVLPRFRQGQLREGILEGVTAIEKAVTVPVSWLEYHKWHLIVGVGVVALVLSGIFLEGRGHRGLVWLCFGGAIVLLFALIAMLVKGKEETGFGGGNSGGGGATGSW